MQEVHWLNWKVWDVRQQYGKLDREQKWVQCHVP
jgi:hypothetical protein